MQDIRIPSLPLVARNSACRQSREMKEEGGACSVGTAVTYITTSILISCPTPNNPRAKPRGLTEIPASRRYCHSGTEPAAEVETTAGVFPGSGGTDVVKVTKLAPLRRRGNHSSSHKWSTPGLAPSNGRGENYHLISWLPGMEKHL